MKKLKSLGLVLFALAICLPAFGQKRSVKSVKQYKSQYALTRTIIAEIDRNFGKRAIVSLRRVKTKKEFVSFLKAHVKKCKSCPTLVEFTSELAVVDEKYVMQGKLTYGQFLVGSVSAQGDEEGTDPDPDIPEPDDDRDEDSDEDMEGEGGGCPPCGPLNCLSNWGLHIPCCGMPSY